MGGGRGGVLGGPGASSGGVGGAIRSLEAEVGRVAAHAEAAFVHEAMVSCA